MSAAAVARRWKFRAKHFVPGAPAPWNEEHHHLYTVEAVAEGDLKDGIVVETDDIDEVWGELRFFLDGQDLNDTTPCPRTTVEELATWMLGEFRDVVPEVVEVTVWEDGERWGRARA